MTTKSVFSIILLGFVAVSVAVAMRKVGPQSPSESVQSADSQDAPWAAKPVSLDAKLAATQFSAVYFHSPHRCPTCRKIETFAHEALTPEVDSGKIAWQTADYTADLNASLVNQFKVFTSTVVLVEVQAGKVVRWKNLEEVWDHTSDQGDFTTFINQSWSAFQAS